LPFADGAGNEYLIETGAPYDQVERVLRSLLVSLGIAFPVIVGAAVGGGYLLMRNALRPMDEIATTAERITSRNLNERVPVVPTGDEVERLSISLNRMMERLEDAFHHISRFSADAAYEIRTPLAIIRGELENALQAPGLTAELRETIGSALEEAERLSRIVEQLLEMSRLEAGETLVERTRFDFADMTRTTVDQMRLLAEEKNLQLRFESTKPVDVEGIRCVSSKLSLIALTTRSNTRHLADRFQFQPSRRMEGSSWKLRIQELVFRRARLLRSSIGSIEWTKHDRASWAARASV
jgi:signal transduction histidine kinase